MGWKIECIFANEGPQGYFGTLPDHQHERAMEILPRLYPRKSFVSLGTSGFLDVVGSRSKHIAIGAYEHGCVLSDLHSISGCSLSSDNRYLRRCLSLFPEASILVFEIYENIGMFGYAMYEKGRLQRAFLADGISGIYNDEGEVQPEEYHFLADSELRDGRRWIHTDEGMKPMEYADIEDHGNEAAFAFTARMFGTRLDQTNSKSGLLQMELFRKRLRWLPFLF
jgi:hypothetical protein